MKKKVKPVVRFVGGMRTLPAIGGNVQAVITSCVGHPVLGDQPVITTSLVKKITVETLNTKYVYESP